MSKIALSSNVNGTGTFTIASPNSNTDRTLTLPDAAGTVDRLERAGNVLQVVSATYSTDTSTSSSAYSDTGLSATITPTSASSKILVLVNQSGCAKTTSNTGLQLRLVRGSTTILTFEALAGYTASTASNFVGSCSACFLDSPNTTSATTYKTQFSSQNNTGTVGVQTSGSFAPTSTITLIEIAA